MYREIVLFISYVPYLFYNNSIYSITNFLYSMNCIVMIDLNYKRNKLIAIDFCLGLAR